MFVIKNVAVLSGKYLANFTRIPDSAGCLHFTGYRIVLSGSGTSLHLLQPIRLTQVVSTASGKYQIASSLIFTDVMQLNEANRPDATWWITCIKLVKSTTCIKSVVLLKFWACNMLLSHTSFLINFFYFRCWQPLSRCGYIFAKCFHIFQVRHSH